MLASVSPNQLYDRLVYFASLQDSLLQSYRNLFLTSQSILFAIAVFVVSGSKPLVAFPLLLLALGLLREWVVIARSRGFDVWFFHLRLLKLERGEEVSPNIFTEFKSW